MRSARPAGHCSGPAAALRRPGSTRRRTDSPSTARAARPDKVQRADDAAVHGEACAARAHSVPATSPVFSNRPEAEALATYLAPVRRPVPANGGNADRRVADCLTFSRRIIKSARDSSFMADGEDTCLELRVIIALLHECGTGQPWAKQEFHRSNRRIPDPYVRCCGMGGR